MTALAVALVVCAVALAKPGHGQTHRLRRLLSPPAVESIGVNSPQRQRPIDVERLRGLAVATLGAAALLVVPWPAAPVVATCVMVAVALVIPQLERRSDRDERRRLVRDLPLCLDLLAACWSAGVVPRHAAATVAAAMGDIIGTSLRDVAIRLDLGSAPEDAWRFLRDLDDEGALDAYRSLVAAASSGVPPVAALRRAAMRSRDLRRRSAEGAARTVAVKVAARLGLCFLPAFVLLAIAPAVLGALGPIVG